MAYIKGYIAFYSTEFPAALDKMAFAPVHVVGGGGVSADFYADEMCWWLEVAFDGYSDDVEDLDHLASLFEDDGFEVAGVRSANF